MELKHDYDLSHDWFQQLLIELYGIETYAKTHTDTHTGFLLIELYGIETLSF